MLTLDPEAIRSAGFAEAWPGYDRDQVTAYLGSIADALGTDQFLEAGHEVAAALRTLHDNLVAMHADGEAEAREVVRVAQEDAAHLLADADATARTVRLRADEDAAALRSTATNEVEEARLLAAETLREARDEIARLDADRTRRAEEEVARLLTARSDELAELTARHDELRSIEADVRSHLLALGHRLVTLADDLVVDLRGDRLAGAPTGPLGPADAGSAAGTDAASVSHEAEVRSSTADRVD